MISSKKIVLAVSCAVALATVPVCHGARQSAQAQTAPAAASRQLGTVKAISGNTITLTTDAGTDVTIISADNTRIVRTAPGQKDLSGATAIALQDIQVGDRMLVRTKPSDDGTSLIATAIIVMKKTDIAEKQSREREDWQRRGVGGPVTAVDAATGAITVATSAPGGGKQIVVHTAKNTIVRRYAPDSIRFDDAKVTTLDQIKPGDQLRARGDRSADGSELSAEEIVAGTFRNIAGTIVSADAAANTITVTDLATKKPVVIKVTTDSQLHKLPPATAMGIAMRLKGGQANGQSGAANHGPAAADHAAPSANGNENGGARNGASRGDFNQMLAHLPVVTVGELKKGDALMIVSTQGDGSSVTVITLLSGVEPILTASPKDNGSMILTPWNFGGGGDAGDAAAQ